jgi:hypothetical protein
VSVSFFADTCAYLDPRRTHDLIAQMPIDMTVQVAAELVRRGDYVTISRFIDFVTDEQTRAVVAAIEDEAAILRVAFYMGSKNRMDHLFQTLPPERIERMIVRVEEERDELLPAFLSVLIHVSYARKRELGDIIAAQDPSILSGYIRATHEQRLWRDVLPVVASMSAAAKRKLVNLPILSEHSVQEGIIHAADDHEDWGLLLPLIAGMDDSNREAVAEIVAAMNDETLGRACDAALMGEHWETLLDLVRRMPEAKHAELGAIVGALLAPVDPELLERIARRAQEVGVGQDFASESRTGVSTSSAYS